LHDLDVNLQQRRPHLQPLELMTIFGNAWVTDNAPWCHSIPNWCYIIRGFGSLGGTILVVTCCRNCCPIASQNFFVCQKSLYE